MITPILDVKDIHTSLAFYTEKLGFKQDFVMQGPDGNDVFAWVSHDGNNFAFNHKPDAVNLGIGIDFMIYVADETDIDSYYAQVQANGVAIASPIEDAYWGDRVFTVHDPNGYALTFAKTVQQVSIEEAAAIMRSGTR